jgi:hypothetical protein
LNGTGTTGAADEGVIGTGAVGLFSGTGTIGTGPVLRVSSGDGVGVAETGVGDAAGVALSALIGTVVADEEAGGVVRAALNGTVVVGGGTVGTEPVGGLSAMPFSGAGGVAPAEGTEPVGGRDPIDGELPGKGMTAVLAGGTGAGAAGVVGEGG